MALFFLSPAKSYLVPIAIQLFQEKGRENPVCIMCTKSFGGEKRQVFHNYEITLNDQGVRLRGLILQFGMRSECVGKVNQIEGCFLHDNNPVIILLLSLVTTRMSRVPSVT